ncbi:MAG: CheR family methyltransferase [Candidatus Cyclobacteriaceae bacterium M3_2C_046]
MQEIEITELRKLTEVIRQTHGYDFTNYAMSSFKRRVLRILELDKIGTVDLLIKKIKEEKGYIDEFLREVTVNVTEMFRDPSFWREVRDHIIPSILLNHSSFSIWHAGCSSGEEVFSMAILLKEMGIYDQVKIFATDLDKVIIDRAKKGEYHLKNMEINEKNYIRFQGNAKLTDYYQVSNGKIIMDKSLLQNVIFREHDLVRGAVFNKFDLILCRNVMIYFNQTLQNEVLKKLHDSLFKYGYLVIGSKESLIWCDIANKFIVVNNEEKLYKKIKD